MLTIFSSPLPSSSAIISFIFSALKLARTTATLNIKIAYKFERFSSYVWAIQCIIFQRITTTHVFFIYINLLVSWYVTVAIKYSSDAWCCIYSLPRCFNSIHSISRMQIYNLSSWIKKTKYFLMLRRRQFPLTNLFLQFWRSSAHNSCNRPEVLRNHKNNSLFIQLLCWQNDWKCLLIWFNLKMSVNIYSIQSVCFFKSKRLLIYKQRTFTKWIT